MAKSAGRIKAVKRAKAPGKLKMKTKKSAAKRYRVLGSGKVKCSHANRGHNTGGHSASRQNRLSKGNTVGDTHRDLVRRCLPNDL